MAFLVRLLMSAAALFVAARIVPGIVAGKATVLIRPVIG